MVTEQEKQLNQQQAAIQHLVGRIATLVGTSVVTNDNNIQVTVVVSKGLWSSLQALVSDDAGALTMTPDVFQRILEECDLILEARAAREQAEESQPIEDDPACPRCGCRLGDKDYCPHCANLKEVEET